ncbi:MAG: methionyl-tRNA formyltransferase [Burkholderiaceae bacterium]|jgi:methionyl-tRNA formyltransferase|nr:methionyl-tRNA formyltransferase [Burkholderiaceae bacterium]MDP4970040.1 methionyl-tRNA formyltransferase [Burkholderiaceae bacterium]MDP5111624.1 methionyl-tRNA formyltransferase [Burkholderiaceae bacterium]
MRVGFAGTPEFSRLALQAILKAGFKVPLVLTQPDRPSGRGLKLTPSAVKQLALEHNLPLFQPRSLRLDGKYPEDAQAAQLALQHARLDVLVVAAYGLILPTWVLQTPGHGCLNIHASLLPRWRGAAPIQRAIEAGDTQTGVTIMQMDEGLDTGAMLLSESLDIASHDNAASLHDKLAEQGARLIVQALHALPSGSLSATAQPETGATYASKLDKSEAMLALNEPAERLARRIRAFNPAPGATIKLPGIAEPVKVWDAIALSMDSTTTSAQVAGDAHVIRASADGIDIATGHGVLRLLELQRPGGKRQYASAFITGWSSFSR